MAGNKETAILHYNFVFDTIAQEQLIEAVEYYNSHASEEVGKRFLVKVETVVEMICVWPEFTLMIARGKNKWPSLPRDGRLFR